MAAAKATGRAGAVDITSLSIQELAGVRKNLEEDIGYLEDSLRQLQGVVSKFGQAKATIKTINPAKDAGTEMLVPITSSLYIAGEMVEPDRVMVEVGTGFFVEKSLEQGVEYCDRRAKFVMQQGQQVSMLMEQKNRELRSLDQVMQQKLQMISQQPGRAPAGM